MLFKLVRRKTCGATILWEIILNITEEALKRFPSTHIRMYEMLVFWKILRIHSTDDP